MFVFRKKRKKTIIADKVFFLEGKESVIFRQQG